MNAQNWIAIVAIVVTTGSSLGALFWYLVGLKVRSELSDFALHLVKELDSTFERKGATKDTIAQIERRTGRIEDAVFPVPVVARSK